MTINNAFAVFLLFLIVLTGCSRNDQIRTEHDAYRQIKEELERMVLKDNNLKHALLLVHSDKYDFHWKFAFGTTGTEQRPITSDDQLRASERPLRRQLLPGYTKEVK